MDIMITVFKGNTQNNILNICIDIVLCVCEYIHVWESGRQTDTLRERERILYDHRKQFR